MPESSYLSPGVYVEEIPSAIRPIAGVSTTTAGFVGIVPDKIEIPQENPKYDPTGRSADPDSKFPYLTPMPKFQFLDDDAQKGLADAITAAKKQLDAATAAAAKQPLTNETLKALRDARSALAKATADQQASTMADAGTPVLCTSFSDFKKYFGDFSIDGLGPPAPSGGAPAKEGAPGTPTPYPGQSQLAHGVYGFFNNQGVRCYVMRFKSFVELKSPDALVPFEAIDEIFQVAAPGITDEVVQQNIIDHCVNMGDRFAILDCRMDVGATDATDHDLSAENVLTPSAAGGKAEKALGNTDYGAFYFPWLSVYDPATGLMDPTGEGLIDAAPSGHVAGIYARVDNTRGVHKAPANEVVRGAEEIGVQVSKPLQDGLNPRGVNCIRIINDNVTVWGARTIGGDANADTKYISVRRTLLFLRKSIDQGTNWVVFEPNNEDTWAKIIRNVTNFLTNVWRDGALFGSTPEEAFYVKCDAELNTPAVRDLGQLITEIGVAIVRPAEFVIFRITQWQAPQA